MTATPSSAPTAPTSRAWTGAFRDLSREHGFETLEVEGQLPSDLNGTLYRNGPALFGQFGQAYGHWFDGDGAVSSVRFGNGTATGAVKLVQSEGLVAERRAGQRLFASYGSLAPGSRLQRLRQQGKNAANTAVMIWQNRLYALFEGGKPTELSPLDLDTMGERDLDGAVLQAFSAHPHYLPMRHAAYNFGMRHGRNTSLDLFELPDNGPARRFGSVPLSGATMIHDFIATPRYLIFFAPPLRLDLPRLLLGMTSYSDSLRWQPNVGTEILVVPIDNPSAPVRFTTDAFYQWHFANAFEEGNNLVVDFVRYPDFASNGWLGAAPGGNPPGVLNGALHRATIDLSKQTLRTEQLWDQMCEFPRVKSQLTGQPHRYVYLAAGEQASSTELPNQIAKFDIASGAATVVPLGPGQTPSEPIFVARSGATAEDDGYLLTLVYDAPSNRSHVAVLDARDLEAGPLARVWFDHHIPLTFHGIWQSARADAS